jgi:hypothetical protein
MAARKTQKDLSKMTPEDRAAYEAKLEASRAPRPAYLAYTLNGDGKINVALTTRSAEEVLKAVDENRELKYQRIMVK